MGCSVLIVEDHESIRQLLARLFRAKGCSVCEAGTVAEALDMIDPPPDCAVIDLGLPDGDGEQVARAIRNAAPVARLVVHSAIADVCRRPGLSALGATVITKPGTFDALLAACRV
jgi:two-component system OmpR family response regulator